MATTARTQPFQADSQDLRQPLDFFRSNFLTLVFSGAILYVFLFTPWFFNETPRFNGANLFWEALFQHSIQLKLFTSTEMILIPAAALLAGGFGIWGLVNPTRSALASLLTIGAGLLGLYYFVHFYTSEKIAYGFDYYELARQNLGTGFKVTLIAMIGLTLQSLVALVPDARRIIGNILRGSESGQSLAASMSNLRQSIADAMPRIPRQAIPYLFLAIPLALYIVWIIAPTIYTFYLSLTHWEGIGDSPRYIGLRNYKNLFKDRSFREALGNNVRWLAVFITVPTTMGLGLAMVFNTEIRGGKWYKVGFYSPLVLSGPVISLVWLWLYNPELGLLNSLLDFLGVIDINNNPPGWHADSDIAIYCIIAAAVWRQVGYVMVLYLAGLKNIDPAMIDAGLVDGANRWQLFRHVIFPLLAPVTTIIFVISVIDSLRAFDLVQIMTRGGNGTQVLANMMFQKFKNYEMGYAAAVAVVLFTISIFFIGIYLWRNLQDELEY